MAEQSPTIRGRQFARELSAMKKAQRKDRQGRHGRKGALRTTYFTVNGSNTRSQMRTIADIKNTAPVSHEALLEQLWEIVRTM